MEEDITLVQSESVMEEYLTAFMDQDNITEEWILINTPVPVLLVIAVYLLFVLRIGPRYMETRPPYQLTTVLRAYNIIQILCNCYYIIPVIRNLNQIPLIVEISCRLPTVQDDNVNHLRSTFLRLCWGYLVLKMLDLLDTLFMVLRKKNSHVTFLHVYHHVGMVFFTWFTIKYIKAHQAVIPGIINVTVHAIMYTYYFLATFGPEMEKYLWWKRHLTKLQLAQFAVILLYLFLLYYNGCAISRLFTYIWIFNIFVIFCLFLNFYIKSYILKSAVKDEKKKN